ncbi:villin [Striga asiatica]|uniref:Villin n=1 Tax=Striga asiatica TaxID=4170 RepID=A0A5A7P9C3_STRAF|nr:villin [Striga asiatica]
MPPKKGNAANYPNINDRFQRMEDRIQGMEDRFTELSTGVEEIRLAMRTMMEEVRTNCDTGDRGARGGFRGGRGGRGFSGAPRRHSSQPPPGDYDNGEETIYMVNPFGEGQFQRGTEEFDAHGGHGQRRGAPFMADGDQMQRPRVCHHRRDDPHEDVYLRWGGAHDREGYGFTGGDHQGRDGVFRRAGFGYAAGDGRQHHEGLGFAAGKQFQQDWGWHDGRDFTGEEQQRRALGPTLDSGGQSRWVQAPDSVSDAHQRALMLEQQHARKAGALSAPSSKEIPGTMVTTLTGSNSQPGVGAVYVGPTAQCPKTKGSRALIVEEMEAGEYDGPPIFDEEPPGPGDEAGIIAIKTIALDAIFSDRVVQYRELHGHESHKCLPYFNPCFIPLEDGVASGFKKFEAEAFAMWFYILKQKRAKALEVFVWVG